MQKGGGMCYFSKVIEQATIAGNSCNFSTMYTEAGEWQVQGQS